MGQKDFDGANNVILHGSVTCALLGGIVFIVSFFLGDILDLMNFDEYIDLIIDYLTPLFLCSFVFMFSSLFTSTLQLKEIQKHPLYYLLYLMC